MVRELAAMALMPSITGVRKKPAASRRCCSKNQVFEIHRRLLAIEIPQGKCGPATAGTNKKSTVPAGTVLLAGVVSLELTARGFGDRCSTN